MFYCPSKLGSAQSFAKTGALTPFDDDGSGRSLMKMLNNVRLKTEPCGTPHSIGQ